MTTMTTWYTMMDLKQGFLQMGVLARMLKLLVLCPLFGLESIQQLYGFEDKLQELRQ
jgi:hypothetical protein